MVRDKAVSLGAQPKGLAVSGGASLVLSENAVKAFDDSGKELSNLGLKYNAAAISASPDGKVVAVGAQVSIFRLSICNLGAHFGTH